MKSNTDFFFSDPAEPVVLARAMASDVVCRLLLWMADARTLEERGLRATVVLYCVRPDLVDGATLEEIGEISGRTRQAVHKLAESFRTSVGLSA